MKNLGDGREAYIKGIVKNPYKPGTPERVKWQKEWDNEKNWRLAYWNYKRNSSLFS